MLSRHLYRIDEVSACCKYALLKRNYRESLFWSMELCDSLMSEKVLEIMLHVWFYGGGSYLLLADLLALMEKDEITVEEILLFVGAFCCSEKDGSILYILAKGALDWEKQPDTFAMIVSGEQAAVAAIKQRKVLFAWTLLRCRWETDAWDVILSVSTPKMLNTLELLKKQMNFVWESRAAALLLVCGHGKLTPVRYYIDQALVDEWSILEGRRARRIFAIRAEACFIGTERSKMSREVSNLGEIREPLTALHGSLYWDTIAEDFSGWKPIYKQDASKEAFYELYFPDDVPDEWSLANQEKSHGRGFFIEDDMETRHTMNLYGKLPSLGLVSWTHDAIRCGLDLSLYETKQSVWAKIQLDWDLRPRKKKIVLCK